MSVIQKNISMEEDIDLYPIPTKPNYTYYKYELIDYIADTRVYSDDINEISEYLVPGGKDDYKALLSHAVDTQVALQAQLANFYIDALVDAKEFEILMGPRHEQPNLNVWNCQVPLVLIDSFYAPYTEVKAPIGRYLENDDNLIWLTPGKGVEEYLKSLDAAGVIQFNILKSELL